MRAKRERKQNLHRRHCFALGKQFAKVKQFTKAKGELHRGEAKMKKSKASGSPRRRRTFAKAKAFTKANKTAVEAKGNPKDRRPQVHQGKEDLRRGEAFLPQGEGRPS